MLQDANKWLNNKSVKEKKHPKTGATALHVAAAKGYMKVMRCVWLCCNRCWLIKVMRLFVTLTIIRIHCGSIFHEFLGHPSPFNYIPNEFWNTVLILYYVQAKTMKNLHISLDILIHESCSPRLWVIPQNEIKWAFQRETYIVLLLSSNHYWNHLYMGGKFLLIIWNVQIFKSLVLSKHVTYCCSEYS